MPAQSCYSCGTISWSKEDIGSFEVRSLNQLKYGKHMKSQSSQREWSAKTSKMSRVNLQIFTITLERILHFANFQACHAYRYVENRNITRIHKQNEIRGYSKWLSGFQQLVIHNTLQIAVYEFFYLIEQHSKFLLHTLQVLYMCTLCDSTNINTIINNHRWHATNSLDRNRLSCWCL